MKQIVLVQPWGRFHEGATLTVWSPGAAIEPGVVDPSRAERLVAAGLAVEKAGVTMSIVIESDPELEAAPAPATVKSRRKGKG